ncbi:MAG: FAD-dependent oxidoreductase [Terracidiphilus sp.]
MAWHDEDVSAANDLTLKSCDGGVMISCVGYGAILYAGDSVKQDLAQALSYEHKACDGGSMAGCIYVGYFYQNGIGTPIDAVQAADFYRKSCDGGEPTGCRAVGWLYRNGLGVALDEATALSFLSQGLRWRRSNVVHGVEGESLATGCRSSILLETVKVAIIGGGIVGLATALQLLERYSAHKVLLLEKESGPGRHQTGHNSGGCCTAAFTTSQARRRRGWPWKEFAG